MYKYISSPALLKWGEKKWKSHLTVAVRGKGVFLYFSTYSQAQWLSRSPLKITNCGNEQHFILLLIVGPLLATYSCSITCWGDNEVIIGGDICSG